MSILILNYFKFYFEKINFLKEVAKNKPSTRGLV